MLQKLRLYSSKLNTNPKIDEILNWKINIHDLASKLNRVN